MARVFNDINEVTAFLLNKRTANGSLLIGVDGLDGSGKTTFSQRLAKALSGKHVQVDKHLDKDKGEYVAHISCDTLKRSAQTNGMPVIIEGVCLLSVARKCRLHLDQHIYLKRIGSSGWYDSDLCLATKSVDELVAEDIQLRKVAASFDGSTSVQSAHPLFVEQAEYHRDYKPLDKACLIFELCENVLRAWKDEAFT